MRLIDGKAQSCRDVQFSPTAGHEFAAVFETGILQLWDLRAPATPERRINAHNGFVLSVDYHPSGRFLATGGRDRQIKVCAISLAEAPLSFSFS
jgi:WD repeat-containing protein 24